MSYKAMKYTCYFDGGCLNNPGGKIGFGCWIETDNDVIYEKSSYRNPGKHNSNNTAEYYGLMLILKRLNHKLRKGDKVTIKGDSKLVIMQMAGHWKIGNGHYTKAAWKAKALLSKLTAQARIKFLWIPREENSIADELATEGLKLTNIKPQ